MSALGQLPSLSSLTLGRRLPAKSGHWRAVQMGGKCSALLGRIINQREPPGPPLDVRDTEP